jgi:hypothetical protein
VIFVGVKFQILNPNITKKIPNPKSKKITNSKKPKQLLSCREKCGKVL